jgi:plasmid stabilization system protein ParE
MRPVLKQTALADLNEAREHFERQDPGLGSRFLEHMDHEFSRLVRTAGSHRVEKGFHRFVASGYHQLVFYRMEAGKPVVYAVLDGRRDPAYNRGKLSRPA